MKATDTLSGAVLRMGRRPAGTPSRSGSESPGNKSSGSLSGVMGDGDRGDASLFQPAAEHRHETRAAMLRETLQLANYSALTQALVAIALIFMMWDVAPRGYLLGMASAVTLLCAATVWMARHVRTTFAGSPQVGAVRRGFLIAKLIAFSLGASWATMPAVMLPTLDNAYRIIVVAVCAGLISDAYVVGPIFGVAISLAAPVVFGLFIGLMGCEAPVGTYIAILLVVYAAFVLFSAHRMCLLSYQRILDRVMVQKQSETIGLLLNEFEEGASDWLWETDPNGHLKHAQERMAELLGRAPDEFCQSTLQGILRDFAEETVGAEGADGIAAAMAARQPFHERIVCLAGATGARWWSLNGKPAFDRQGAFIGYRGVGSDVTLNREAQARIAFLAGHDALTGLLNRASFQDALPVFCRERSPQQGSGALFYLDLDGFKAVNDGRGHRVGDRLLRRVARRLGKVTEAVGEVYRLGGDEFAIIARGLDHAAAEELAAQVVAEIRRPFHIDGGRLEIGVSIGIAFIPDDAIDPANLLGRADLALYDAKEAGKGSWRCFDPSLEEKTQRHRALDLDMRDALTSNAMELHYQPLVDTQSGRVVGFEALLRWHRAGQGWVSPGEIIPIAEASGFIIDIGRWALRRACTDALAWGSLRVAVNISSMHVRMPTFHDEVAAILRDTGLPAERLEIEITESVLLSHEVEVLENLRHLRAMGVKIALDDFGTGYSSLSYLTEFPFDKVKVDRSFVRDLQRRPEKVAVVEAIARMARALSMNVTVEGVETQAQLTLLRAKQCDIAQGFLFSPARPASEIREVVRQIESSTVSAAA